MKKNSEECNKFAAFNNMKINVYLYSLGCAKNQVESEMMSGMLQYAGFRMCAEAKDAEVIIVNTCGFLTSAKQEAIHAILELAQYKESGKCRLLLAVGCMPEKYAEQMHEAMPEIDAMLGSREYQKIVRLINEKLGLPQTNEYQGDAYCLRALSTPPYMAYLKIADGCDNCCSYCLIPQLRGKFYSRKMEDLIAEAKVLLAKGVKEIVLIAQDTTAYGKDIYGKPMLHELLDRIASLGFHWVRIMYCYPARITDELLQVMSTHDNICHYLDLPIQHSDDEILAAMNRTDTNEFLRAKIQKIREYMPECALRTTVMVGFPGEKVKNWKNLLSFLQEVKFTWTGVFAFSREKDTKAYSMPHQVKESTKERRRAITSENIAKITYDVLESYMGSILEILVEGVDENGLYYGRSSFQAYEVDGQVIFTSKNDLIPGQFVKVRIVDVIDCDLVGEEYEFSK